MDASASELARQLLEQRAWLRELARRLARADEAEDLVQDTCVAALERPGAGLEDVRAWLAGIARNLARGARRTRARRERRERRAARPEALPSTQALVERVETEQRLARALVELREPYRTTLLLRYHAGLSAADVARREDLPEGTVRWRTKRGLDELRARLERDLGGREALALALFSLARTEGTAPLPLPAAAGPATGAMLMGAGGKWIAGGAAALVLAGLVVTRPWSTRAGDGTHASPPAALALVDGAGKETPDAARAPQEHGRDALPVAAGGPVPSSARIVVLEADGRANSGKRVLVRRGAGEPELVELDDHGVLVLAAGTGPCALWIERDAAVPFAADVRLDGGEQVLHLPPGEVLAGRIEVDGSDPRRPLELELAPASARYASPGAEGGFPARVARTRTDARGTFAFRGLAPGEPVDLRLPAGHALPGTRPFTDPDARVTFRDVLPGRGQVFSVERFPSLTGRLLEADGRTPAVGRVDCRFTWSSGTSMDASASAAADGGFELFLREPWRALDLEYAGSPGMRGRTTVSFRSADVGADGFLGDLRLAPGRTIVLCATDPDGRPVQGARTDLESPPTDARGETLLRDVTAACVRVAARGFREASVDLPARSDTLVVRLERAPELLLEVRDRSGVPVGDLVVELRAARWLFDRESPSMLLSSEREGRLHTWRRQPFVAVYTTDPGGRLRCDGLVPGIPFEVRVLAHGGALVAEESMDALAEDERRKLPVQLAARAIELRGRVCDERGAPVAGATLDLPPIRSGSFTHFAGMDGGARRTDADGRFACTVLDLPGAWIGVRHPDFLPIVRELAGRTDGELELRLERGLRVSVRVLDERGRPQPGGTLGLSGSSAGAGEIRPVAPGRFEVRGLRPGRNELVLRVGGREFVLPHAGHEPELTFRVPAMGSIAARWELPRDETTSEFLWLEVLTADGRLAFQQGFHDVPGGEHTFDPVVPGDYEALLKLDREAGDLVLARRSLRVAAGEVTHVVLEP